MLFRSGLSGWYVLSDLGVGISTQNYVSECRAKKFPREDYVIAAGVLAIGLLILTITLLRLASPYLGPLFLKNFSFMGGEEKIRIFGTVGTLIIGASIGVSPIKYGTQSREATGRISCQPSLRWLVWQAWPGLATVIISTNSIGVWLLIYCPWRCCL